jgi:hypothetical protein
MTVATTFFGGEPYGSSDSYVQGSEAGKVFPVMN